MRTLTPDIIDLYNGLIDAREKIKIDGLSVPSSGTQMDSLVTKATKSGIEIALDRIAIMFIDGGLSDHKKI